MNRSKLKSKYHENRTDENWSNYKKQKQFCVTVLRKTKKQYFQQFEYKKPL